MRTEGGVYLNKIYIAHKRRHIKPETPDSVLLFRTENCSPKECTLKLSARLYKLTQERYMSQQMVKPDMTGGKSQGLSACLPHLTTLPFQKL